MLGWVVSSFAKFVVIKLSSCNQAWQIIHLQIYIYIYLFIYLFGCGRFIYIFLGCGTCVGYSSLFYCFILQCKHLEYKVLESFSGIFRWPSHDSFSSHLDQKLIKNHISTYRPYLSTCGPMADITPKVGKNGVAMMTIWVSTSLFFRNSHSEISKILRQLWKIRIFWLIFPLKWV